MADWLAVFGSSTVSIVSSVFPQAADAPKQPAVWEVVTGILGIPAALVGLALSYVLIKKTRNEDAKLKAETEKIGYEILEKKRSLGLSAETTNEEIRGIIVPLIQSNNVQYILLRFVLLFMILQAWQLVGRAYSLLLNAALYLVFGPTMPPAPDSAIVHLVGFAVANLADIAYWIVFTFFAWPLFKDIGDALGIRRRELVPLRRRAATEPDRPPGSSAAPAAEDAGG